jgi:uncharacterized membrane protein
LLRQPGRKAASYSHPEKPGMPPGHGLMLSTVSFHPFLSHFPVALFTAGMALLWATRGKDQPGLLAAVRFNLSLGLLAAVLSCFTGMVSADLNLKTNVEVEGHQGYSFLFTLFLGISAGYSYTRAYSRNALLFYSLAGLGLMACIYSGYLLVFPAPA